MRRVSRRLVACCLAAFALLAAGVRLQAQEPVSLARLQFDIVGVRLMVDPPALTVPKNIATQINTSLLVPDGVGASAREAIAALTDGAVIEAELRGPSIPATRIQVAAGQPIPIPPLAVPGDYVLDGIRLIRNGQVLLDATSSAGAPATTIPIRVISEVFVAGVTSRVLTLEEIQSKGIVIDQHNFQAVNFQVAFNVDGARFTIDVPAALPTPELLRTTSDRSVLVKTLSTMNQVLAATQTSLPPEFDRPGLNFSIAALPFFPVPDDDGSIPALTVPPVTGLVVIPGNVAFLNQFFSVMLLVTNVAPDGSSLELRDVTGTIALPTGNDRVNGTSAAPGDDPLRLARLEGVGIQPTVAVVQPGPDGKLGTSDDIATLPPSSQGQGEFLVEGLAEGGHTFDIALDAVLDGLPSGPVRMKGQAAGAVFVRNPTFAVTLAHPRTIRAGEPYTLYATVTNTSRSAANLVTVNLDPRAVSGAQLVSDSAVTFPSLAAGQSATAAFSLIAQQTGEVTASSFTGAAAAGGGIRLTAGIGERGVPLAPNAIVLPKSTDALPASLVAAAQRVLGQAFSIATAPAEALPEGVLFVKRQAVIDRGLALAEAGERIGFGEPIGRVVGDLLLDWLGNHSLDAGFDQLLRETDAGAAFLAQVGQVIGQDAARAGPLDAQREMAQATVARAPHLSLLGTGPSSAGPVLSLTAADGTAVTVGTEGPYSLVSSGALALAPSSVARLAVVASPTTQAYVAELRAVTAGAHDLGLVLPGTTAGSLQQLRLAGVTLGVGGVMRVAFDLGTGAASAQVDPEGDGTFAPLDADVQAITDAPPRVVAVRQLTSSIRETAGGLDDPATYGLLLGVLFDHPVTAVSAEVRTHYAIDRNEVLGARLQPSGRVVYLYLQKPLGSTTPRTLTATDVLDLRGNAVVPDAVPIATILTDGGRVFGQVRSADGQGVAEAVLSLAVSDGDGRSFTVSTIRVDRHGSFDFEFLPRVGAFFTLTAQHPVTRDLTALNARLRGAGEQLLLNPTFTGLGTVRGRLLRSDGVTPLASIPVGLLPGSVLGVRGYQVTTNALGEFVFTGIPVGNFTLTASDGQRGYIQLPGLMPGAGQTVVHDLVLVEQPEEGGRLVGRVFLADGTTPAQGFLVYAGEYRRDRGLIAAVQQTTTDATGSFVFPQGLPARLWDVVAVDPATQQLAAAQVQVSSGITASVSLVLEATGAVEGVVFNGRGQPVAGAVVAGGTALVTADANGFFRITGVPAGSRTIEAGDPVTRRRGSATVTVLPNQVVRASLTLESRATIVGRVLDAAGNPVPRASVRIPQQGGFIFVIANNQGVFTFPDLPLGDYLLQAPGPSADSLVSFMEANGIDPASAFTTGDAPAGTATAPVSSDANAVLAAYQRAVQTFLTVDESLLGLPMASLGGFGWNRVQLFQDATTSVADVRFLSQGTVSGRTEDGLGRPTGALTRITGLSVSLTGAPRIDELGRTNSDAATGAFSFRGIPRFDLATFQAAGVRGGDFTVEAAQPFSPAIVSARGQLNTANPDASDVVLRFPLAVETNGTLSGRVFLPDGVTPAPADTEVAISFGSLTVRTDGDGRFVSSFPIPGGGYTLTARSPNGLRGQVSALVPAGGNVDVQIRLLGAGGVTVQVRRPDGVPVQGAAVRLTRATFPNDSAQGTTDGTGTLRFGNLTEGPFEVVAEEPGTGLSGRGSGVVLRDGDLTVPVVITASGRVTGTFVTASTGEGIPFAQVVLSGGGMQAYAATDAQGRFELLAVPVGAFGIDARDPASNRVGRGSGELRREGETVDVTVVQVPRGTITGIAVQADGVTPVAGARVELSGRGPIATALQATARDDGSFRFEGISAGSFDLKATDPVSGFDGRMSATLASEGQIVDTRVQLAPYGALRVTVRDHAGALATNASVSVGSGTGTRTAVVAADGTFTFEFLRLGSYALVARSLGNTGDVGENTATLSTFNETVEQTITLRGTGAVSVAVVDSDGTTPVSSARVTLTARGAFGETSSSAAATTLTGFTGADGRVTFEQVPIGDVMARAEAAALAGVRSGTVATPDVNTSLQVQLGAAGSVAGRVLLPGGTTPAAEAIVTLRFQSLSQLQSGVLQVTTGLDGRFSFTGIPLGTLQLDAIEVVSRGTRRATATLTSNGQALDLGELALDNSGPRVLSIVPSDGTAGVAPTAPIVVTFDEPVNPATVSTSGAPNVRLFQGTTSVALAAPLFSDGNRVLTLRPVQPLTSGAGYLLTIQGSPDGPQNEAGLPMPASALSGFTVLDVLPPVILSASPAVNAVQVASDASVRVTFSEPVTGATITLRTAAGTVVPGQAALAFGNTVAIFTPQDFLQPNGAYQLTVSGVSDLAGNVLAGGAFTAAFTTVDTLAPVISTLQLTGTPRAGATLRFQPVIAATDTARVEFAVGSSVTSILTTPYAFSVQVPAGATAVTVTATAVDASGNRSEPFIQSLPVQPNLPPSVQLTNLAGSDSVTQGQVVNVRLSATDDDALAQVLFSAVGAATLSESLAVAGAPTTFTTTFPVMIPAAAATGSTVTVQAAAVDAAGSRSTAASLVLQVRDGLRPDVTVLSPVNNAQVVAGQPVTVTFDATDDVGLASVALVCTPVLAGCESRPLLTADRSTRQAFTLTIPSTVQAPATVTLLAVATDTSGNVTQVGRALRVADTIVPTLGALTPAAGSTRVVAGTTVTLRAPVSDNVGVTALLVGVNADVAIAQPVVPALTSGTAQATVSIPADTVDGSTLTVHVRTRDDAGNESPEATIVLTVGDTAAPTLELLTPDAGTTVAPGGSVTFRVRASDDVSVARIVLTATGAATGSHTAVLSPPSTPAEADLVLAIPVGTPAGLVTFTAQAFDATGNASLLATRDVTVLDRTAPVVTLAIPSGATSADPRQPLLLRVSASDEVGVVNIHLVSTGLQAFDETRVVTPAVLTRTDDFTVALGAPPVSGGTLEFTATVLDAAGNIGTAHLTVPVLDVVLPGVSAVQPADGATGVDPAASVLVSFSEPMDRASITGASVRLAAGATAVPVSLVVANDDRSVTLIPLAPLTVNTLFTVTVDASVRDRAGNPLASAFTASFRTSTPDAVAPRVVSIDPTDGATGVATTTAITVTFSEPVAPTSVTSGTFHVSVGGTPMAGRLTLLPGNEAARFTPTEPLPFEAVVVTELTAGITDLVGNPLAADDGTALTTPRTFTFLTGSFAITSPSGPTVIENTVITLEAAGGASLSLSRVVFSVNGVALDAVTSAPFRRTFTVPTAATTAQLVIVASARNAQDVEVARATRTVTVSAGLGASPALLGIPRGATRTLRLSLPQPVTADLPITLSVGSAAVATVGTTTITIPAGARTVDVPVTACATCPLDPPVRTGAALGNTTLIATSASGTVTVSLSVSDPVSGQALMPLATPAGLALALPPSAGLVVTSSGRSTTHTIGVLTTVAAGPTVVSVESSDPTVATATATAVLAGQRTTALSVTALAGGVATLTVRAGTDVWAVTVFVGAPPPNRAPLTFAPSVGMALPQPRSAGQLALSPGTGATTDVALLEAPAGASTPVSVTSSNSAVATATAADVAPGATTTSLTITGLAPGTAVLTVSASGTVRSFSVIVGTPSPGQTLLALASPVGVSLRWTAVSGQLAVPLGSSVTVGLVFLPAPASTPTSVTVTTSDAGVVQVPQGPIEIPQGSRVLPLALSTGAGGTARITIAGGGIEQVFTVTVGSTPSAAVTPVASAQPVGLSLMPSVRIGRVIAPAGNASGGVLGVQLLGAPRAADVTVTVTSSNPAVAGLSGATTLVLRAGELTLPTTVITTGAPGVAVLTFEFEGERRELVVVVGSPSAAELPAVVSPVIGVQVTP